jgi:hypothetical protein
MADTTKLTRYGRHASPAQASLSSTQPSRPRQTYCCRLRTDAVRYRPPFETTTGTEAPQGAILVVRVPSHPGERSDCGLGSSALVRLKPTQSTWVQPTYTPENRSNTAQTTYTTRRSVSTIMGTEAIEVVCVDGSDIVGQSARQSRKEGSRGHNTSEVG